MLILNAPAAVRLRGYFAKLTVIFLVPRGSILFSQYCTTVVNGVLYVSTDRGHITRLGTCGFESVKSLPDDFGSGIPVCAPTPDSKLMICSGLDCAIFDPESENFEIIGNFNDYHSEGKLVLDPISGENIVVGGTHRRVVKINFGNFNPETSFEKIEEKSLNSFLVQ